MSEEIELKLAMAPAALTRLRRHPLLRSLAGGRRSRKQQLRAIYFDTPDRRLAGQGVALRLRSDGKRILQTLKAPTAGASGLQRLRELEAEVKDWKLELDRIGEPDLVALLAEPGLADALVPVFETHVERRSLPIRLLDSEVEVAFDQGEIVAGPDRRAISEAELELLQGRPERLYQLALTLFEQTDFRIERQSKAARGHALADGSRPQPVEAERVRLGPEATTGDAFVAVVRSCLTQLLGNERALLAAIGDPEAIHQFRVAVRRLRAALALFTPAVAEEMERFLAGELEWLQEATGPARDWDVFALQTLAPLRHRMAQESGLDGLVERVEALRLDSQAAVLGLLRERRYTALLLKLEMALEDGSWARAAEAGAVAAPAAVPVEVFLQEQLAQRIAQVLRRGRKRDEADEASLHRLRIAGKKLRYAIEFFRSLLPKARVKSALAALKQLQDCLGSLNDAAVGHRLLAAASETAPRPLEARALGLVVGWQAARAETDLKQLRTAWKKTRRALTALAEA